MKKLKKQIFKFKLNQHFDFISRLAFYTCLIYVFNFKKYMKLSNALGVLLLYPLTVFIYVILYFIIFNIRYKRKAKNYEIDYEVRKITQNCFDEDYKKGNVNIVSDFKNIPELENIYKENRPDKIKIIFNKKEEIKIYEYLKNKDYKVVEKEYLYSNLFKNIFRIGKNIRFTAKRL